MKRHWGVAGIALLVAAPLYADGLLPPLTETQVRQAKKALADFKSSPKGPYFQIRWFCNDGSVHPPAPPPCATRGGGFQHAELSATARHLAEWNLDLDTVLAGHSFDEFLDAKRDYHRLKELVLDRYLAEVDDGWIYRKARYYRGARQVEDEEKAGRKLLVQLLSNPEWLRRNYFLAGQIVAAVPHGAADRTVDRIRSLAKVVADHDSRFGTIRAKIHSLPSADDRKAVEDFLNTRNPPDPEREQLTELATLLKQQYNSRTLAAQLPAFQKKLGGSPLAPALAELAAALESNNAERVFGAGAVVSFQIRQQVAAGSDGRRNLDLIDLAALVLESEFQNQAARSIENPTRRRLLGNLLDHYRYAAGAGLLSLREFDALRPEVEGLVRAGEAPLESYYQSIRYLARSTEWCRATVLKDFGPVAGLYDDIEPAAAGLVDHLVRGSPALALSNRLEGLIADANRAVGIRHSILGQASGRGIVGLNPGVALGRLGIIDAGKEDTEAVDSDGIYVIPETIADLKPMAGILTLDSGNALSHAQLLAANLGIPNATIPSALLPQLRKLKGQEMFFAVTGRRVVVLEQQSALNGAARDTFIKTPIAAKPRVDIDTARLNLKETRILPLADLGVKDSGVKVGPKAANLAQLAKFFPEHVAPGVVIPFGIYYEHVNRVVDSSGVPLARQISEAFAKAEQMRQSGASQADVSKFIYPKLTYFRKTIETMQFLPAFEKELLGRMQATFGAEGTFGVFVRSDTNAEDLPEFTGAGLNLTVPNQVGAKNVMQSIKDVWASPFTERAYEWRSKILRSSEHVYPSVVLLRTVPSDKSGVIGTMNLETGVTDEVTVNVSEGISAVVDGGVAESLLLKPNGEVRLLDQARSPYKKVALPAGNLENRPASGDDYVLTQDEIRQVRQVVAEVKARYPVAKDDTGKPLPWDIEFGFEKGQFRLFQIRPLVRYHQIQTLQALSKLETGGGAQGPVKLDDRP